jgi:SAM-dependent methyltransferase
MVIADLGAGEGAFALLLAQRAKKVIAVDTSAKMIEVAASRPCAMASKTSNTASATWKSFPSKTAPSIWSSSRSRSITPCTPSAPFRRPGAFSVPGGRIVVLDLLKHRFEEARELYADEWLGFSEAELETMLEKAGFTNPQTRSSTRSRRRRSSRPCWRWGANPANTVTARIGNCQNVAPASRPAVARTSSSALVWEQLPNHSV